MNTTKLKEIRSLVDQFNSVRSIDFISLIDLLLAPGGSLGGDGGQFEILSGGNNPRIFTLSKDYGSVDNYIIGITIFNSGEEGAVLYRVDKLSGSTFQLTTSAACIGEYIVIDKT